MADAENGRAEVFRGVETVLAVIGERGYGVLQFLLAGPKKRAGSGLPKGAPGTAREKIV